VLKHEDVLSNSVFLSDTGKSAHIITVDYFTAMHQTTEEFNAFREQVNFQIITLLEQKETALAAASADIVIHQASSQPSRL
jgi:MscS family membrane protein